jgi:hypothetical protein
LADTAKALCEALTTSSHKGPLLHLRGTHTTLDMAKHFRSTSLRVENLVVYDKSRFHYRQKPMKNCVNPHPSYCQFSQPAAPDFLGNLHWIGTDIGLWR